VKRVYLDVAGRMHSLYRELVQNPPSGYRFVTQQTGWDKASSTASKSDLLYSFHDRTMGKLVPVNLIKAYLEKFKKPPQGTDLTYAAGHLVFRKEPWVMDLEFVTQLTGYSLKHFKRYRKIVERILASEYCKKIICWTEAGKQTVLGNMDCSRFKDKVETVPLAVSAKNFTKDYREKDKVKLLFVGSVNIPGEFIYKGGLIVLEAFLSLKEKYRNLELVVRSDMPRQIKARYAGIKGLRLIEGIIPREQLEEEYKSTDIFLFPSHSTPGLAILEAMSYELPVVTTDLWANPEMVTDGKTGFTVKKSRNVNYYAENFIPIWDYHADSMFMKQISCLDVDMVTEVVEKTGLLIENKELRRNMGRTGRETVENGKFSLNNRNEKLKKIFDEATRGKE